MTPDYSHVPLARKLGIRAGYLVLLDGAPPELDAWLQPLPEGVELRRRQEARPGSVDVALAFATELRALGPAVGRLEPLLTPAGGLWLCSPKKASRVPTDIDFAAVQALGLGAGLVDNKVASLSDVWTGMRFVRRLRDRGGARR